jgi:hypothetical protein
VNCLLAALFSVHVFVSSCTLYLPIYIAHERFPLKPHGLSYSGAYYNCISVPDVRIVVVYIILQGKLDCGIC